MTKAPEKAASAYSFIMLSFYSNGPAEDPGLFSRGCWDTQEGTFFQYVCYYIPYVDAVHRHEQRATGTCLASRLLWSEEERVAPSSEKSWHPLDQVVVKVIVAAR